MGEPICCGGRRTCHVAVGHCVTHDHCTVLGSTRALRRTGVMRMAGLRRSRGRALMRSTTGGVQQTTGGHGRSGRPEVRTGQEPHYAYGIIVCALRNFDSGYSRCVCLMRTPAPPSTAGAPPSPSGHVAPAFKRVSPLPPRRRRYVSPTTLSCGSSYALPIPPPSPPPDAPSPRNTCGR